VRSDTKRNQQQLIRAVAEEVRQNPNGISMQSVAVRAKVGVATAYRYFSSLDELLTAYMVQIMEELQAFVAECELTGSELFDATLARWVDLVLDHGKVMVQLRSRSGYLDRLDHGDLVIGASLLIWERPVAGLLEDLGLQKATLRQALFICNALSDPREVLDLHEADRLSRDEIRRTLSAALTGALRGLNAARTQDSQSSEFGKG